MPRVRFASLLLASSLLASIGGARAEAGGGTGGVLGPGTLDVISGTYLFGETVQGARQSGSFDDHFDFTVPEGSNKTFAAAISRARVEGISELTMRLYAGSDLPAGATPSGGLIESGEMPDGSADSGRGGSALVLPPTALHGGHYVLEVSGSIAGDDDARYSGVLSLASGIPEPGSGLMLLCGVASLAVVASLRRRAT